MKNLFRDQNIIKRSLYLSWRQRKARQENANCSCSLPIPDRCLRFHASKILISLKHIALSLPMLSNGLLIVCRPGSQDDPKYLWRLRHPRTLAGDVSELLLPYLHCCGWPHTSSLSTLGHIQSGAQDLPSTELINKINQTCTWLRMLRCRYDCQVP